jgi:hypothetical protein
MKALDLYGGGGAKLLAALTEHIAIKLREERGGPQ